MISKPVRARCRWVILVMALVFAAAVYSDCGGEGDSTTVVRTVERVEVPRDDEASAPEVEETTSGASESSRRVTSSNFYSPSHNIACGLSPEGAICDTSERDWTPYVPKPSSCKFDWGPRVGVNEVGPGEFVCVSDSLHGGNYRVLPYGGAIKRGGITCTSHEAGVACMNEGGGGFFVSRQMVKLL